jgi:hypothetical protein
MKPSIAQQQGVEPASIVDLEGMMMYYALQHGRLYLFTDEQRVNEDWGFTVPIEDVSQIFASAELVTFYIGSHHYSHEANGPSFISRLAHYGFRFRLARGSELCYLPV